MARTFTLTPVPEQTQSTGTQSSYPSSSGFSLTPIEDVEERSWGRAILDQGVSVAASVPRAAAGLASFAGMVPGVNYVADPLASGLNYIGDAISEHGLSDYQKNEDEEFANAIRESSMQLGPDAEWSDHLKNIASQGGAAASYLASNPAQAVNVALETLPYLFGGGLAARTVNAGVKMASGGQKALSAGTSGAIGEGIMAGGATTDQIVQEQRAEGIEGWTPERLYGGLAGLGTLGIGRLGNRIQGPADIDAMVAGGFKQAGNATNGPLKGALKGGLTEGAEELLQGAQEEAFVNQAMGRPLSEDVGSSAVTGSIAGSGLGTLAGGYAGAINRLAESSATKNQSPFAPNAYSPVSPDGLQYSPLSSDGRPYTPIDPMQDPSVIADTGTDMGNGLDPSQDPSVIADQGANATGDGYANPNAVLTELDPINANPTTVDPNAPQEAVGGPVLSDMPEAVPGSEVAVDTPEGAPIEAGGVGPVEAPVDGPIEVSNDNPIVATVDGIDFVQDPEDEFLLAPTDGAPVRYDGASDVWYDENGFEIPNPYAEPTEVEAPADGPGLFDPNVDEVPVDAEPVVAEPVVAEAKPKKKGAVKKRDKAPKAPEINKEEPNINEPASPKERMVVETRENLKKELSDLVEKAKKQRDKDKKKGLDRPSPELNKIAKEISGRKKLLAASNLRAEKEVGDPEVKAPVVGRKGYDVKKVDATVRYGGKRSRALKTNISAKNLGAEILKRNDGVKGPDVYVQTNGPSGAKIKWSPKEKKVLDEALDTLLQYEGLGDGIPVKIFQRHPGKKKDSRWWNRGALNHSLNEDANYMALYIEDIVQAPSDKSVSNVIAHEIGVHGIMRITPDSENSKGEKIYDLFQKTWDENRDEIRRWLATDEASTYRGADMRTQVEEYFAFALENEIRDIANGKSQGYSQKVKRYLRQVQAYLDELLGKSHTIDQVAEMLVSAAERSIQKQGLPVSEIEMWNKSKGGLFTYYLNDDGKWKSEYPDSPKKVSRQVDEPTGVKYDKTVDKDDLFGKSGVLNPAKHYRDYKKFTKEQEEAERKRKESYKRDEEKRAAKRKKETSEYKLIAEGLKKIGVPKPKPIKIVLHTDPNGRYPEVERAEEFRDDDYSKVLLRKLVSVDFLRELADKSLAKETDDGREISEAYDRLYKKERDRHLVRGRNYLRREAKKFRALNKLEEYHPQFAGNSKPPIDLKAWEQAVDALATYESEWIQKEAQKGYRAQWQTKARSIMSDSDRTHEKDLKERQKEYKEEDGIDTEVDHATPVTPKSLSVPHDITPEEAKRYGYVVKNGKVINTWKGTVGFGLELRPVFALNNVSNLFLITSKDNGSKNNSFDPDQSIEDIYKEITLHDEIESEKSEYDRKFGAPAELKDIPSAFWGIFTGKGHAIPQSVKDNVQEKFFELNNRLVAKTEGKVDLTGLSITGMGGLKNLDPYLQGRYKMMGDMQKAQKFAEDIYKTFSTASKKNPDYNSAIFDYLTGKGVDGSAPIKEQREVALRNLRNAVPDKAVVAMAIKLKAKINANAKKAVEAGLLKKDHPVDGDQNYLPRLYLKHIMETADYKVLSGGGRLDLSYAKKRNENLGDAVRAYLGEVKDAGFLGASTISQVGRDLAISDFLKNISESSKSDWVLPGSTVKISLFKGGEGVENSSQWKQTIEVRENPGGKQVSIYWLKEEADRIAQRAGYTTDPEAKALATELSKQLNELYKQKHESLLSSKEFQKKKNQFRQVPISAKYGRLSGMWINKRIYNDLFAGGSVSDNKYWQTAEKLHAYWKVAKVPLNPPTVMRNVFSNMVLQTLEGMNPLDVGKYNYQAVMMMIDFSRNGTKTKAMRIGEKYGLGMETFTNQEMASITKDFKNQFAEDKGWKKNMWAVGKVISNATNYYGKIEQIMKLAVIQYHLDNGAEDWTAFRKAQDTLFDYSLLNKGAKAFRKAPIGAPFLSFSLLAMRRLGQVTTTNPMRLLYWWAFAHLIWAATAGFEDVDEEDLEKLHAALPEYLSNKPAAFMVPLVGRDANGRMQFIDLSYTHPFGGLWEMTKSLGKGELDVFSEMIGMTGAPLTQMAIALSTGIDPFTKQKITNDEFTLREKLWDRTRFMWRQTMPSLVTGNGALYKMYEAGSDKVGTSKLNYGEAKHSMGQAALRILGINVYGVDPSTTAIKNVQVMKYRMADLTAAYKRKIRDPNLSEEARNEIILTFQMQVQALQQDMFDMLELSKIHPNLKIKDIKK